MIRRFVDTFYYLALLNPRDHYHRRVVEFHAQLSGLTLTTDAVLVEVANALAGGPLRDLAAELIRAERDSPDASVMAVTSQLVDRGLDLYANRRDKQWSLTDCISFVVMADEGITEALTADHHFVQAGFHAVFAEASPGGGN